MNSKITSEKGSSRRDFLVNAGLFTAGAIAAGGVVGALSPRKAEAAAPALPWGYPSGGLTNLSAIGAAAYYNYGGYGGCMSGTGKALVDAIAAVVPDSLTSAWSTFNNDFWRLGGGGINSWGTLCGSVNAGCAIISMVVGPGTTTAGNLINEFMGWYCDFAFPTTRWDLVTPGGTGNVNYPNLGTSVCKSPLCHQSSGKWAHTYNKSQSSLERKDRCGKVAADCAYKVAELLNAWEAGSVPYAKVAPDYQDGVDSERCFACHQVSPNNNEQGRMDCLGCHPDKVCHNAEI